ncbi:MAG: YbaK/EbsC family protein [Ignavibacteria bacterium]|jgi:prolyl-tRNA editing enzyme YbaK/EbsC (Cys-tRNA(Pro) deacylase)
MELSKHSKKVQKYLNKFNLDLEVVELPNSTRTAEEAANAIGCKVGQIIKSLIFKNGKNPVLILVSGDNKLNVEKFEKEFSISLEKADAKFVKEKTGFSIGGVPPAGHKEQLETFIDEDLLQYDEIWAAAGMPFSVFRIESSNIQKITGGKIIKIS